METTETRGIRNKNPFNIKRSHSNWIFKIPHSESTDETFEQFASIDYGLRAGFLLIKRYITKYHAQTLRDILTRFAPASENNLDAYFAFFEKQYKLPADLPLFDYPRCSIDPLVFGTMCSGILWYESRYDLTYTKFFDLVEKYKIFDI